MAKNQNTNQQYENEQKRSRYSDYERYTWRYQLKRLPWLLLIPLGLFIPRLAGGHAEQIERYYSRMIYPYIAKGLGFASHFVPLSIAEIVVIIIVTVFAFLLLIRLLRLIFGRLLERKRNRVRLFSLIISLLIFAGVMLNLFYALWGLNHFRQPLNNLMALEVHERSSDELASACELLAAEAAELRKNCPEDQNGVFKLDRETALKGIRDAYLKLGTENELFANKAYPAKTVLLSMLLSRLNIAGIYSPYTSEANVNAEQPDLYFAAGAAHESAHYFGFAREDEADFIAYFVSLYSDDPAIRYSAVMLALNYCGHALDGCDHDRYKEIVQTLYTPEMVRDVLNYNEYYEKYADKPAAKANDIVNDTYLKHNGQSAGVNSYGNMVDLLLAFLATQGN